MNAENNRISVSLIIYCSQVSGYLANLASIAGQTFLIFFPVGLIVRSSLNS